MLQPCFNLNASSFEGGAAAGAEAGRGRPGECHFSLPAAGWSCGAHGQRVRHTVSRPCAPFSPLSSLQGEPGSGKAPQRYKRRAGRRDGERAAKKAKKGHQAVAGRQLADVSHVSGGQHQQC